MWFWLVAAGWAFLSHAADVPGALAARFASPPAADRILKIIHGWPDDATAQDRLRATLLAQGFGGVVCNVSFDRYLESDAHWQAFVRAVTASKAAGMALWLYDEKGYPSGNAGGLVLREHPDWEAEGLLAVDAECGAGPVSLQVPPGKPVLAAAFEVKPPGDLRRRRRIDLPLPVDGQLVWNAPAGQWRVLVITRDRLYAGTHAELNLAEKMPYVNLLRAEPTRRFLEITHGRYAAHLGADLGCWFEATFTDEPSLMSLYLRRMPYRPLPWSPGLPAEFRRRRGYDLEPVLPDLVLPDAGPQAARHRYDYWLTVGELVSGNYFGQIQDWCRQHHVGSGGHLLAEENIVNHVPLYGDFFRCVRRMDAPSIDCLTSLPPDVPWYIARLVASAAELEGHALVMCETSDHSQVWRPAGDHRPRRAVTEAEIRGTCNRLFVAGVNTLTSYYSFTGLADEALRRLNEWVGRCATQLRGGHQVADVAVVYPVESLWTVFVPAEHWAAASPQANRIGGLYRTAVDALFDARREFTVIDSRTLAEAKVEQGTLVHGALRWRAVVLPGVTTLPMAAWRKLERLAREGGLVIALGARPQNSEREFPGSEVAGLGQRLFGETAEPTVRREGKGNGVFLPAGTEVLLPRVLDRALEPDVVVTPAAGPLRTTHRRVEGRDVYFVVNDSALAWEGTVTPCGQGEGRLWDPATGGSKPIAAGAGVPLKLGVYEAAFLTYDQARLPVRRAMAPGPLTGVPLRQLGVTDPMESHGEFVQAELSPDDQHQEGGRSVWRARATLTREKVDTFLFVRMPVLRAGELDRAELLEVESWVPAGQRAPAQLLVILHESGGADYLAETPRSLGVAGYERTFIPLNRFQLAGWSKDDHGVLDRADVSEIRIGWGGYYGRAGERVEFSVAVPKVSGVRPE